ncbi:MAG: ribosome maturation factor RimM [Candidatus Gastranaerophilales bacterium]|nr:ribosome maturation factor RimM [Candidatus Gastranaerophilales bacterium]
MEFLSVGKIINFHGIQGEVKVGYTQGKEKQLKSLKEFFVCKNGQEIKLTVQSLRFHKNNALFKFKEINSIDEVLEFKGLDLKAEKTKIVGFLQEDEFYINDLVGSGVFDENNNLIGIVDSIATIKGEDLLAIKDINNNEHLIPFVKKIVPDVDIKNKKIIIDTIPGLIEK